MNYYDMLEVSPAASAEVIRAAYKSLMQRHHPDKNPGNADVASRAALLVQAYEVLSDAGKRMAYDVQLSDQALARPGAYASSSRPVRAAGANHRHPGMAQPGRFAWYPWLLISVLVLSGWLILSLSKKKPAAPVQEMAMALGVGQAGEKGNPASLPSLPESSTAQAEAASKSLAAERDRRQTDSSSRTIALLSKALVVRLKDAGPAALVDQNPARTTEHSLSIPALVVKAGTFDTLKIVNYIDSRRDAISAQLAERLASARYEELVKVDGELYLKKIILDALGDITGTNRLEEHPPAPDESPGRYGITDVFLPEFFILR